MAHTGICMLTGAKFAIFHKYVEDIMGRPVQTIEMGLESVRDEITEKSRADFIALCEEDQKPSVSPQPCGDCISREAALDDAGLGEFHRYDDYVKMRNYLKSLQSISPMPKMGKWIVDNSYLVRDFSKTVYHYSVHCKDCGWHWDYSTDEEGGLPSNYCPNCGLKMEAQEGNREE